MIATSLELSKRLKEAEYPQKGSSFYHCSHYTGDKLDGTYIVLDFYYDLSTDFAAPTAEEILEELPKDIIKDGKSYKLQAFWHAPDDGEPCVRYVSNMGTDYWDEYPEYGITGETFTEALGLMYIHLKENNLLALSNKTR